MKRSIEDGEIEGLVMAKCLMLLSRGTETKSTTGSTSRVFECKTCNRQFPSFQALGGHRASHKKPRLMGEVMKPAKMNQYRCSICGLKFRMGQALGGHMRRHRAGMSESLSSAAPVISKVVPVVKRSNSRRVLCLDLNLTPLENDLNLLFGKLAPKLQDVVDVADESREHTDGFDAGVEHARLRTTEMLP